MPGMGEGGGCSILGSSRCAGPLDQRNRLLHGDLPLPRAAAGMREGGGCFWGELRLDNRISPHFSVDNRSPAY